MQRDGLNQRARDCVAQVTDREILWSASDRRRVQRPSWNECLAGSSCFLMLCRSSLAVRIRRRMSQHYYSIQYRETQRSGTDFLLRCHAARAPCRARRRDVDGRPAAPGRFALLNAHAQYHVKNGDENFS